MTKHFFKLIFILYLTMQLISQEHPFMIVKESEYENLRKLSNDFPWSEFKNKAIEAVDQIEYYESDGYVHTCNTLSDLAGALGLCYILFPENKEVYVNKFETDVYSFLKDIRMSKELSKNPTEHGFNVGPSQAAFMIYLTLDIMYNDIEVAKRNEIEADLEYISLNHHTSWEESKFAIEGMYALYNYGAESVQFIAKKNQYREFLLSASSPDGVYTTGPGYTHSRLYMNRRTQKKIFIDICEYQGYYEFYSDSVFVNLHEWIFGYSVTPFNRTYTFGDSPPMKPLYEWATSALRLNRFSPLAQSYAAWYIGPQQNFTLENILLNYLLTDTEPAEAIQPESRVFKNGGAWLLGDDPSPNNFAAVLWNINTEVESHSHFDANSINLVGYGEFLIRNSGYNNWQAPDPETWDWLHRNARSSNTVTVNNKNHVSYRGDGIVESIIGYDIEYATAKSGQAIINGKHLRSILFIKPVGNIPGYFVVFDEVEPFFGSKPVNVYFHPNSYLKPEEEIEGQRYKFKIKNCSNNVDDLYLTIFYNDKPDKLDIAEGYRGSYESCSRYYGKYLNAKYSTEPSNYVDAAVIFYPHRNDELAPAITAVETENYNLTKFKNVFTTDYLINPKISEEIEIDGFRIKAACLFVREKGFADLDFWCYKGSMFQTGGNERIGYSSDTDVMFLLNGRKGEIVSTGARLRVYYPGITQFLLDGRTLQPDGGGDWIDINVSEGNHKFEIVSSISSAEPEKTRKDFYLSNNYPNPFNPFTKITYSIPETIHLKIVIYDSFDREIETVVDETKEAGTYSVFYNKSELASGVYYYKLITEEKTLSKKMILLK
ncbi:chitinase [hydrocarbon metagenome]|uniref:Chitinase n=1 Tax=hydrocarbon metagenome TaxID=938273 RepID=A0A0W8FYW6_9ZZZZ